MIKIHFEQLWSLKKKKKKFLKGVQKCRGQGNFEKPKKKKKYFSLYGFPEQDNCSVFFVLNRIKCARIGLLYKALDVRTYF